LLLEFQNHDVIVLIQLALLVVRQNLSHVLEMVAVEVLVAEVDFAEMEFSRQEKNVISVEAIVMPRELSVPQVVSSASSRLQEPIQSHNFG
jgi:hypothetical protein